MSSLAGALASPPPAPVPQRPKIEDEENVIDDDDVDMDAGAEASPSHEDEEMGDLFGEDNEVESVKHDDTTTGLRTKSPSSAASPAPDGLSAEARKRRQELEYEEPDEPPSTMENLLQAEVNIPNVPVPKSSDGQYWVVRMPNFVKVDSKPFHRDTYVGPEQDEDADAMLPKATAERNMAVKLRVENTIRWRWVKDETGEDRRQSNARVVKWSDGTMSLRLGKEYFDVSQVVDNSAASVRHTLGASQSQSQLSQSQSQSPPKPTGPTKSQGLTYLVAQHKWAGILQAEALVTGYMSLRPTDMQSETHRLLVRAVGQKSKTARMRLADDPPVDMEKEKQELMKAASKKPRRTRADPEDRMVQRRKGAAPRRRTRDTMWSDDDEEEAEFEMSEDGEDNSPRKRRMDVPEGGRRGGEYQEDDFLVADSDEEGGGGSSDGGARKRKKRKEEAASEDELEKLESKISQQEERRRAQQKHEDGVEKVEVEEDADMDVESEEEEDTRIRSSRRGPRRRAFSDEEEDE